MVRYNCYFVTMDYHMALKNGIQLCHIKILNKRLFEEIRQDGVAIINELFVTTLISECINIVYEHMYNDWCLRNRDILRYV